MQITKFDAYKLLLVEIYFYSNKHAWNCITTGTCKNGMRVPSKYSKQKFVTPMKILIKKKHILSTGHMNRKV